jgi:transposase-like protein
MAKSKRQWSKEQKRQIIQEVEVNGLQSTLRKFDLSHSLFHKTRPEGQKVVEKYN